ncbi:MAG: hypothetical protein M0Q13_15005 [Methanothrix sp.]|jgi:hypothetical protein|nr:hypothetical protein [Methanothrix sp.]
MSDIKELINKRIFEVLGAEKGSEGITLKCTDGTKYMMYHEQVGIDNIIGDIESIKNNMIINVSETNPDRPIYGDYYNESFTWTDFMIETKNGKVIFQWLGVSNGYYSEVPVFKRIDIFCNNIDCPYMEDHKCVNGVDPNNCQIYKNFSYNFGFDLSDGILEG